MGGKNYTYSTRCINNYTSSSRSPAATLTDTGLPVFVPMVLVPERCAALIVSRLGRATSTN